MKTKNLLIMLSYCITFLVGTNLYAQDTMHSFSNGEYYLMSEDLEGPDTGQQYFLMEEKSNAVLDGSSYYYALSMEQPHYEDSDCMGIKITCESAGKDTVRRVRFDNCKTGLYIAPLTGGGLVEDCQFIENDFWGFRMGRGGNRDIEITECNFSGNKNGAAIKSSENVWFHHNSMPFDTLTAILLRGHTTHGPAKHNIIEHNKIKDHGKYGLEIEHNADSNIVRFNELINDGFKFKDHSDYNFISDNHISNCDTAIIVELCSGNIFERDTIENSIIHLYLDQNSDVIFTGTIFDSSKLEFVDDNSQLTVQWYLDIQVVDESDNPLEDVVVDVFDKNDNLVCKDTTDENGTISTQKITAYLKKKNQLTIFSPFRVETNVPGYDPVIIDLNENTSLVIGSSASAIIENNDHTPKKFALEQNYPNPFNPNTKISYQLANNTNVSLKIYDIHGRLIRILINEYQTAGYKSVYWDGKDKRGYEAASGIYFYSLDAGNFKAAKRMVLMH